MTDEKQEEDAGGVPQIFRVSARIGTLERRCDYLEAQIEDGDGGASRDFDKAELKALKVAIVALRYHRASVEGLAQPMLALQELVDAVKRDPEYVAVDGGSDAMVRAETLLEEWVS